MASLDQTIEKSKNAGEKPVQKLTLFALTAMVVGSMIGSGIFTLPSRFAGATGVYGALIAWVIAAGGMLKERACPGASHRPSPAAIALADADPQFR